MRVLVLNGGTGTVKAALCEVSQSGVTTLSREKVEAKGSRDPGELFPEALSRFGAALDPVEAVGHRVVHGGTRFTGAVWIDRDVEAAIGELVPLAPLHNPVALAGIRAARERLPRLPMAAVFDTAFHAARPEVSRYYALPRELSDSLELYRYGFHGIAHASLVEETAALERRPPAEVTAVTLQLGQGASACAVDRGRPVETSMGFTPLEGLVMGTRSGNIDPALVLHLLRGGKTLDEVEDLLTRRSGLLGLCGSADMRTVLAAEGAGDRRAALAVDLFVRRVVETAGAYFTLLEGRGSLV